MALEFIDSCAHSGSGDNQIPISRKWTSYSQAFYTTTPSRVAGFSIAVVGAISKTIGYQNERILGAAYYYPSSSNGALRFMGMQSGGVDVAYCRIEADLSISIYSGGNNHLLGNSGVLNNLFITADVFHYYEFHATMSGGLGAISVTCDVKVDGVYFLKGVEGVTGYMGQGLLIQDSQMNQIFFGGPTGGASTGWVCDIYCLNTNSVDLNGKSATCMNFLGDVSIQAVIPVQDNIISWQQVGGTAGKAYTAVQEIPPDDDTSYVWTDGLDSQENWLFQPIIGFTGTIFGAQLLIYAKKDAEGARAFQGQVGGITQKNINGSDQYLYDYYDYFLFPLDTDNGTPWTAAGFNAENFGAILSI